MQKQRRRKKRRRNISRFFLSSMLIFFMSLAVVVGATIFFKVETITVEGNSHYSDADIISATNIQLGNNVFSIKQNDISQKITYSLPYIQSITIKLSLPTEIRLIVQEQAGMVELITEEGTWYMGVQGKLLERVVFTSEEFEEIILDEEVEIPLDEANWSDSSDESSDSSTTLEQLSTTALEEVGQLANTLTDNILSWNDTTIDYTLELHPDDPIIRVTGLTPIDPRPGEMIQVAPEDEKQLSSLLSLFEELEEKSLFSEVSQIHLHVFQYFEFSYAGRFLVKFPLAEDYDYKLRALTKAVSDIEHYETGTMDLTQEQYAVLFMPD